MKIDEPRTHVIALLNLGRALCLALLFVKSTAHGGDDVWSTNGPAIPRSVTEIAISPFDPSHMFAESNRQLFKTKNGGLTWEPSGLEMSRISFHHVAFDHGTPGTVYVGTEEFGLFKTTDYGDTWEHLRFSSVRSLATDPRTAGVVYVPGVTVQRSQDGGITWQASENEVPYDAAALVVAPSRPETLYYASWRFGDVYKSVDTARTWFVAGSVGTGVEISAIAVDPTDSETLYVASDQGLFKSVDGGVTLESIDIGVTAEVRTVAVDPSDASIVYIGLRRRFAPPATAGVFKSEDAGTTWVEVSDQIEGANVWTIAIDPIEPRRVYIGVEHDFQFGGLYMSSAAGGGPWIGRSSGLRMDPIFVRGLAVAPDSASTVYAVSEGGVVFVTTDAGESWTRSNEGLRIEEHFSVQPIAVAHSDPTRLYLGSADGVYRSVNSGKTWERADEGLPPGSSSAALAIDPHNEDIVYVSAISDDVRVFKTVDGGASWTRTSSPAFVLDLAVAPDQDGTVYGVHPNRLVRAVDANAQWDLFFRTPPHSYQALSVSHVRPATVYGLVGGSLYVTHDGGTNWIDLGEWQSATDVATDFADGDTVWISSDSFGAGRSTDGGETFRELSDGLPSSNGGQFAGAIVVAPSDPNVAYAAADGVYHIRLSSDGPPCAGDCSRDGEVTVDEIVAIVNVALGLDPPSRCTAADANGDDSVTVDEVVAAIERALNGCALIRRGS